MGEDGRFITSAGVSAGIDMALALVARLTDEPTARMVQLAIEYDRHPPFAGIDWDQVNRDMYEPRLGPTVQQQLAVLPGVDLAAGQPRGHAPRSGAGRESSAARPRVISSQPQQLMA